VSRPNLLLWQRSGAWTPYRFISLVFQFSASRCWLRFAAFCGSFHRLPQRFNILDMEAFMKKTIAGLASPEN
jgi:hypothetical protein